MSTDQLIHYRKYHKGSKRVELGKKKMSTIRKIIHHTAYLDQWPKSWEPDTPQLLSI